MKLVIQILDRLFKARRARLVPREVMITRGNQHYPATVWVSPDEAKSENPHHGQFGLFLDAEIKEKNNVDKKVALVIPLNQVSGNARRLRMVGITYKFTKAGHPLDGMTLEGGRPEEYQGKQVVKFKEVKVGGKISIPMVAIESRPDLQALAEEYAKAKAEEERKFEEEWQKKRDEEEAKKKPLLEKMHAEAAELRKQIPAGSVPVTVTQTGSADGDPIYKYEAEGVTLSWRETTVHGRPCAIWPNALAPFAEEIVASIPKVKLEEIRQTNVEFSASKKAEKEAREKELRDTPVPESAIKAYSRYHGNEDAAWEAEDEQASMAIRRWAPYIETQRGMHPDKAKEMLNQSSRENYNDQE